MTTLNDKIARFDEATNDELHDFDYDWMVEAVETHDSLADFEDAAKDYNERQWSGRGDIAGFPFIAWRMVQTAKGQTRRSLSVVDFGEIRIALDSDLTDFT